MTAWLVDLAIGVFVVGALFTGGASVVLILMLGVLAARDVIRKRRGPLH